MQLDPPAATYRQSVLDQRHDIPALYGDVDFSIVPERYDSEATVDDERFASGRDAIARVIDNDELMGIVRDYTMTGDRVADAYAALIPEYGFGTLIKMLDQACEQGVDSVVDAPPELAAFLAAMEATPDWVDMDLVERGARAERVPMAAAAPFAIRGAFLATFLNKYAAMPMTMTGTLSDEAAAKRVFETASFFTASVMEGALQRDGKGFQAAAKVRLMHAMVRFHLLQSGRWDVSTYGIPVPQVDQMPAGLLGVFIMAAELLKDGHTEFTDEQKAKVELSRYRCFLLGLPEALLGQTPQEIVDLMVARHISLREGFDDETCGVLVRGTMDAELFDQSTLRGKVHAWMENGFSRFVLINNFLGGDASRAERMGISFEPKHKVAAAAAAGVVTAKTQFYNLGLRLPKLADRVDQHLNARLGTLLQTYGHADFVTNPSRYRINRSA